MDCFFVCLCTLWIVTGGTVPLSSVSFSFWVSGLVCYGSWVWVHLLVLQEHQNTIKLHVSLGLRSRRGAAALRRGEEERGEGWMGRLDKPCSSLSFGQNFNSKWRNWGWRRPIMQHPHIHPHWSSECTWRSEPWQPRTRTAADWTINNCFAPRRESVCSACERLPTDWADIKDISVGSSLLTASAGTLMIFLILCVRLGDSSWHVANYIFIFTSLFYCHWENSFFQFPLNSWLQTSIPTKEDKTKRHFL